VVTLLLLAVMAVQGGEYSTSDWLQLKRDVAAEQAKVDSLESQLDSLRRRERQVTADPAEQERIARERWGYLRPGETLYRLVRPDER
jgi:cell division protein FtsB